MGDTFKQGIDFNVGLSRGGQSTMGSFTSSSQTPDSPLVCAKILFVFPLELLHEVVNHSVVEIFTAQMSVSSSRLDFKDAILNGQDGDIKSTASQVKDQNVALRS